MDNIIFSMLKQLRKKTAKKHGLPPAIIFQESSLLDMANNYPITIEEMSQIQGVGLGKAKKFGETFITLIEKYVKETSRKIITNGKRIKYKGTAQNIYKNNVKSVVWIGNEKENGKGTGSIINNKGEIITNWHVVGNAKKLHIWLLPDDPEKMDERLLMHEPNFVGTVINRNKRKDLALVKVEGLPKNIKVIRFGKTSNIPVGSTVYAIGHPSGEAWTFSSGMVTQIRPNYKWNYENSSHKANVIQHEVPTNPGNSGGPRRPRCPVRLRPPPDGNCGCPSFPASPLARAPPRRMLRATQQYGRHECLSGRVRCRPCGSGRSPPR